jgi:hypothetical protein
MLEQRVGSLVPMVHVADFAASIAFYGLLGFSVANSVTPAGREQPSWAYLTAGGAELMLASADEPIVPEQQAVLFYVYCENVPLMHEQLSAAGVAAGPIAMPFYNPKGEFRLVDPDGYVVMVAHL